MFLTLCQQCFCVFLHSWTPDLLGMTLLKESHMGEGTDWGFSLYFLAHVSPEEAHLVGTEELISRRFGPVIELTHNHNTEHDEAFK